MRSAKPTTIKHPFRLRSEPDFFGFSYQLATAIGGYSCVPYSRTTLAHGWNPFNPRLPERYFHTVEKVKLVQNQKIAQHLNENGYESYSVGIPFINYLSYSSVRHARVSSSVLIVMRHSHPHFDYQPSECLNLIYRYCKERFKNISILAAKSDFEKFRLLLDSDMAVRLYLGADIGDLESFPRLEKAFSENEYLVSSCWGSHLLYGAACGMKVGIISSAFEKYQGVDFASNPWYKKNPNLIDEILKDYSVEGISELCQDLFFRDIPTVDMTHQLFRSDLNYIDKNIHANMLGWFYPNLTGSLRRPNYASDIYQLSKRIRFQIRDNLTRLA